MVCIARRVKVNVAALDLAYRQVALGNCKQCFNHVPMRGVRLGARASRPPCKSCRRPSSRESPTNQKLFSPITFVEIAGATEFYSAKITSFFNPRPCARGCLGARASRPPCKSCRRPSSRESPTNQKLFSPITFVEIAGATEFYSAKITSFF